MVLGAAGGVGLAAVQIGKACGAIVIAVVRYASLIQCEVLLNSLALLRIFDVLGGSI